MAVTFVVIDLATGWIVRGTDLDLAGLPGARPIIDATRFPNLQAAIDVLPRKGGMIRLPPGTFEINKPLMITRKDVLLEGCGTATHIKNVNTHGKPAIVIQPRDGMMSRHRIGCGEQCSATFESPATKRVATAL